MKRQAQGEPKLASSRKARCRGDGTTWSDLCFVLEINRKPVLAFAAASFRVANRRVRRAWFLEELASLRSAGRSLVHPDDELFVRGADPGEAARVRLQRRLDEARGEDTKYCFEFLIPIDARSN